MTDERWTEERLNFLQPPQGWTPNAAGAFAKLRRRDRVQRAWRRSWIWGTAVASLATIVLVMAPAPARCAVAGIGCPRLTGLELMPAAHPAVPPGAPPAAAAKPSPNAVEHSKPGYPAAEKPAKDGAYKITGSAAAPVTIELYSDYECPHCALFYQDVYPQLVTAFVRTGKVRIVHRDFPLPMHHSAALAARYVNAAGELGYYDAVAKQIFATQPEWSANGNVDAAVARILAPEQMEKVRALVKSDPALDKTAAADLSMVNQDQINQTPTLVFIAKGRRQKIAGVESFDILRRYIEELLK